VIDNGDATAEEIRDEKAKVEEALTQLTVACVIPGVGSSSLVAASNFAFAFTNSLLFSLS
jgi:hypothetical protein